MSAATLTQFLVDITRGHRRDAFAADREAVLTASKLDADVARCGPCPGHGGAVARRRAPDGAALFRPRIGLGRGRLLPLHRRGWPVTGASGRARADRVSAGDVTPIMALKSPPETWIEVPARLFPARGAR